MKYILFAITCLIAFKAQAFEYEVQLDNDLICVAKATLMPYEEIGLHRDVYPQVVIAVKGGTVTRLEANGTTTDVVFPTGVAVFRNADPLGELHKSVNRSSEAIELMIIQLKTSNFLPD